MSCGPSGVLRVHQAHANYDTLRPIALYGLIVSLQCDDCASSLSGVLLTPHIGGRIPASEIRIHWSGQPQNVTLPHPQNALIWTHMWLPKLVSRTGTTNIPWRDLHCYTCRIQHPWLIQLFGDTTIQYCVSLLRSKKQLVGVVVSGGHPLCVRPCPHTLGPPGSRGPRT